MDNPLQTALHEAVLTLLRPLTRILIRNGIAYGTFAEWAKKVYVDVAFEDFGEPGKKQTVSRVAALTGVFRREAKRLREFQPGDDAGAGERYNRAVRVISGWINDTRFQRADGEPADLPVEGSENSFAVLTKDYSGDIPTQAMLKVLKAAGSVREREDGHIQLIKRAFVPSGDALDKLHILGTDAAELFATIDHNLTGDPANLFFQRKVSNPAVRADALPAFRTVSAEKAQALLEELDNWLSQHEVGEASPDSDAEPRYVALGIYYSEYTDSEDNES